MEQRKNRLRYKKHGRIIEERVRDATRKKTEKKDSASEKELGLPKRENGLNHLHGKSEGNSPLLNSKFPEPPFYECMKCNSIHHSLALNQDDEGNNICPDCGSKNFKTPKEKPEPEAFPKIVYQLGSDSKEYIELKEKYDKLIEDFKVDINEYLNSTNIEKGTRDYRYWWGRLTHWKGRIK
jgi:DNA-directed RNA polymerase subunit RPC12/RpoP